MGGWGRLLAGPRRELAVARGDESAWAGLAYAPASEGGRAADAHRRARYGVLLAAQYDRRGGDLPLLRFLLAQEIVWYREVVVQYWVPSVERAGLLVAEHRQVEDVWLHWQVKQLGWDAELGYRTPYLLAGGVAATLAEIRSREFETRGWLLRQIQGDNPADRDAEPEPGQPPMLTDADVSAFLAARRTRFADDPASTDLETWSHQAYALGDRDASAGFIRQWADTQPPERQTYRSLAYQLDGLGLVQEAIAAQAEAVRLGDPGWSRASDGLELARLHRSADDYSAARQALRDSEAHIPDDAYSAGLYRHYLRELFLLVPHAPTAGEARHLLAYADERYDGVPGLWMDGVLEAAAAALDHAGDDTARRHYDQLKAVAMAQRREATGEPP
jgi:hypothetical protein